MYLKIALEIIVAAFAVFGFYSLIRLIAQKMFATRNYLLVIEILNEKDADDAEIYLRNALSQFMTLGAERIAFIVSEKLISNDELLRVMDKYGTECYVISDD